MITLFGFGKFYKEYKKRNYFRIQSICPKCGTQIRRAYLDLESNSSYGMALVRLVSPPTLYGDYIEYLRLEEEVKANPTKSYTYNIECPNCGFANKRDYTYIHIKSKEYK